MLPLTPDQIFRYNICPGMVFEDVESGMRLLVTTHIQGVIDLHSKTLSIPGLKLFFQDNDILSNKLELLEKAVIKLWKETAYWTFSESLHHHFTELKDEI